VLWNIFYYIILIIFWTCFWLKLFIDDPFSQVKICNNTPFLTKNVNSSKIKLFSVPGKCSILTVDKNATVKLPLHAFRPKDEKQVLKAELRVLPSGGLYSVFVEVIKIIYRVFLKHFGDNKRI